MVLRLGPRIQHPTQSGQRKGGIKQKDMSITTDVVVVSSVVLCLSGLTTLSTILQRSTQIIEVLIIIFSHVSWHNVLLNIYSTLSKVFRSNLLSLIGFARPSQL